MLLNQKSKIYLLLVLLIGLSPITLKAQDNVATAAQLVEIGDEIFHQTMAVMEARDLYITAVNMDGNNVRANYMAGLTTLQSVDKGEAATYFLKVLELDPEYSFDILYKIGLAFHYDYKFDQAIEYYSRYTQKIAGKEIPGDEYASAKEVERKIYECEQGKIMVEFPEEIQSENIGNTINSPADEYAPVVNQAEDIMIFTSRRRDGNLNPDVASDNAPYEDIFISYKQDSGWTKAKNIGQPINTLYHDSNVGLSKDGKILYIYKDENEGDIYQSEQDENGNWTEPKPLGKPINSSYSETTISISPDGQTLFFASNRKGGYGGLDIWMTQKDKKGDWGDPVNLGNEINTEYNEDGPFIGYDSKTLYFSSEGGEGMGGYDVYRVVYDSSMGTWGAPENMGYPINTPDHDIYFVPTSDGEKAFYSSVRDQGFGNSDIYMLAIPQELHHQEQGAVPSPKITFIVKVMGENNTAVDASMLMEQKDGPDKLYSSRIDKGQYQFVTNPAVPRTYVLSVAAAGYEKQAITVNLPAVGQQDTVIERSVDLTPEVKQSTPPPPPKITYTGKKLRNIYFDFNSAWVKTANMDKVEAAVAYMQKNSTKKMLLVGHSDKIGAERYNKGLSKRRADNVKNAMVKLGIPASRIMTKGEGFKYPLASNDDEKEGRELNRRVEFKVIQ